MFESLREIIIEPRFVVLFFANIPIYFFYYKILFGDAQSLGDSLRQSFQIDIVSFCRGSLLDDWWHTAKIIFWLFLCYKTVALEYSYLFI